MTELSLVLGEQISGSTVTELMKLGILRRMRLGLSMPVVVS